LVFVNTKVKKIVPGKLNSEKINPTFEVFKKKNQP